MRLRARPWQPLAVQLGVYDANPNFNGKYGTDFDLSFDDGVLVLAELDLTLRRGAGPAALPGHVKLGGYYDSGRFVRLIDGRAGDLAGDPVYGNGGVYAGIDQKILDFGAAGEGRGLIPFVVLTGAPQGDINLVPFYVNGGLIAKGPWAARPNDSAQFGFIYGDFTAVPGGTDATGDGPLMTYEAVLEWSYLIQVTPWLQVQPDVQYVIRPGGTGAIADALVLGAQIAVTL
jgi:porin